MIVPIHKTCNDCGIPKPLDEFFLSDRTADGRGSYCRPCNTERGRQWRLNNPEKNLALSKKNQRDRYTRHKLEMIEAYGGKCECCGESEPHFLTLEHKEGRLPEEKGMSGLKLLARLKREGWPDYCTVLCWNCNCAKGFFGFCPHQEHQPEDRRYP